MGVFAVATLLVTNLAGTSSIDALPRGVPSIIAALILLVMVLRSFDQLDIRVLSSIALPLACIGLLGTLSAFHNAGVPAVFFGKPWLPMLLDFYLHPALQHLVSLRSQSVVALWLLPRAAHRRRNRDSGPDGDLIADRTIIRCRRCPGNDTRGSGVRLLTLHGRKEF